MSHFCQRRIIEGCLVPINRLLTDDKRRDRRRDKESVMQYEANSVTFLAEVRHEELQVEAERYRSGRHEATLVPTFGELVVAAAERVGHAWANGSSARGCGAFALRTWLRSPWSRLRSAPNHGNAGAMTSQPV